MTTRIIPSTGEPLSVVGLGTWKRFDVAPTGDLHPQIQVLKTLHAAGGRLIDCSPMYGQAEEVVGKTTLASGLAQNFFYATKVWTTGKAEGIRQMEDSFKKMQVQVMDLMQIHNLVDWKTHLQTLRQWKEKGRIRYIGITHYLDEHHTELENIIRSEKIDFVQFNYSVTNRHAEQRLLPACADHGVATLINRPFGTGSLFGMVASTPLPSWIAEAGIRSWSQFFLKYLLGHPAVTCVIPATANPVHMQENASAGEEPVVDERLRKQMAAFIDRLA